MADDVAKGPGLADFLLQISVFQLKMRLQPLDFLEGAGVDNRPGDLIGKDAQPGRAFLRRGDGGEDGQHAEDLLFELDGLHVEAADMLRAPPIGSGAARTGLRQNPSPQWPRRWRHPADLADAQRNARRTRRPPATNPAWLSAPGPGAGHQVEAGGAVRTSGRHVTGGAKVAPVDQPNAGQSDMRPLCQEGDDPVQEFVHVADLRQLQ